MSSSNNHYVSIKKGSFVFSKISLKTKLKVIEAFCQMKNIALRCSAANSILEMDHDSQSSIEPVYNQAKSNWSTVRTVQYEQ